MLRSLSGLTTRGRCLLAAGIAAAICAVILNERDLLQIAVFVIALPLIVALVIGGGRVRITATRRLLPERVTVGTTGKVRLELSRHGRLPSSAIVLEDGVPYPLGSRPRFMLQGISATQKVAVHYPIRPLMRGIHHLGPLRATVTDPFGLYEYHHQLGGHSPVLAVPHYVELRGSIAKAGLGAGNDGNIRLQSGYGEPDVIVRQYRQGDDLRKVHWKSTARRDEIMVRMDESPWLGGCTVLLDHRASSHQGLGPTSSLEWAISFAASVCLHLESTGHHVRLVTEHAKILADAPANGGVRTKNLILDALTTLQPAHQREITLEQDPAEGQDLIAILGSIGSKTVQELARFRPPTVRSLALLLDTEAWTGSSPAEARPGDHKHDPSRHDVEQSASLLRAAGWGVVVAGPQTALTEAWSQLRTATTSGSLIQERS